MALPADEKIALLSDPDRRRELNEMAQQTEGPARGIAYWQVFSVAEVFTPSLEKYVGRDVGEIAATEGKEPWDVVCDITVADQLRTIFTPPDRGADDESWKAESTCGAIPGRSSVRPTPARTSTSSPHSTTRRRCWPRRCASAACSRRRRRRCSRTPRLGCTLTGPARRCGAPTSCVRRAHDRRGRTVETCRAAHRPLREERIEHVP
jgi:hypothetical protein